MQKTLEVLNCTLENEPLKEAWCDVFNLVVVQLSLEYVSTEVLSNTFQMFTMKNPLPIRLRGSKMIITIVKVSSMTLVIWRDRIQL